MAAWLKRAWESVESESIVNSFIGCFLGDSFYLHIAKHERYGTLFKSKLAIIMGSALVKNSDDEDSDINTIDDE